MNEIFVSSIPKSGSHLLYHVLGFDKYDGRKIPGFSVFRGAQNLVEFKKGWYAGHAPHVPILHSNKVRIFLRRHPGDIIVSWMYFLKTVGEYDKRGPFNFPYLADAGQDVHKEKDKLTFLIIHTKPLMEMCAGWMDEDIHKLKYEDLLTRPEEVLAPIADDTGIPLDDMVKRSAFRGGLTYREGKIGSWKNEFEKHHRERFERDFEELLNVFEYN